jgi:D-alanyl-D-alanine carboxypeptidase
MSRLNRFGSAISFVALASVLAGCAAPQARVESGFGGKTDGDVGLATRALAALNSNDIPSAISLAERAVDKTPNDAGFRGLLGNAYFAGGRFWSAEAAYKDSLSIYSNQPQVILKLALVEIAQGKTAEAVAFLDAGREVLDPADYGLALALAGRANDAIPLLQASARASGADSRVRQNLALAYALAGDWTNARVVASQDVPANQLDSRIQQWMQLAKPTHASDQVAALTGVKPALMDQGQPIRLALNKPDARLAQAAPAPAPKPQPQVAQFAPTPAPVTAPLPQFVEAVAPPAPAPAPVPAVQPAPAPKPLLKPVIAEAPVAVAAPITVAMAAAASPEAPAAFAAFAATVTAPAPKPVRIRKAAAPAPRSAFRRGNSGSVVQLGAYRSPQYVNAAWNQMIQRYPALRAYLPMRARFISTKGIFWRLSITGFDSQREAIARCQALRGKGGSCFVRNFAGDAPVQFASR